MKSIAIILGKNWKCYPPKNHKVDFIIELSVESKLSALAAGQLYILGMADVLLFSGGKTAGKEWPSEAMAMWHYTKNNFKNIPNEAVMLEEKSFDTDGNAVEVKKILDGMNSENILLLAIGYHLPRSEKIFKHFGIEFTSFTSEEIVKKYLPEHNNLLNEFRKSFRVKIELVREFLFRIWIFFDQKGKLMRFVTKRIRHQCFF